MNIITSNFQLVHSQKPSWILISLVRWCPAQDWATSMEFSIHIPVSVLKRFLSSLLSPLMDGPLLSVLMLVVPRGFLRVGLLVLNRAQGSRWQHLSRLSSQDTTESCHPQLRGRFGDNVVLQPKKMQNPECTTAFSWGCEGSGKKRVAMAF